MLSNQTDNIRTYSVDGPWATSPAGGRIGLRVTWASGSAPDLARNEREISKAIEIANDSRSVVRGVVVGNGRCFAKKSQQKN